MMTQRQATKEATRRWGKAARVQHDSSALTEAEKAPLSTILQELRANKTPENRKERDGLMSKLLRYRCDVGHIVVVGGIAFYHIDGSGDTWEEAFAKADKLGRR